MNNDRPQAPRLVIHRRAIASQRIIVRATADAVSAPPVKAEPPAVRNRDLHLVRGELGLQFCGQAHEDSLGNVMRELARAVFRLGYETAVDIRQPQNGRWALTSIRHLRGTVRQPMCLIMWGSDNYGEPYYGTPRVYFDVPDSCHWNDPNFMRKYSEQCDLFVSLTQSGVDDYVRAGLSVPTAVVPGGVDRCMFRPCERDMRLLLSCDWGGNPPTEHTWIVLAAGYMQPRKGLDEAIAAFAEAFCGEDDVALLVKNVRARWGRDVSDDIAAARRRGVRVGYMQCGLTHQQFARILGSVDCLLSAHRREGFGLVPLEALSVGTPVIATRYDGPATYLTPENAILVEPSGFERVALRFGPNGAVIDIDPDGTPDPRLGHDTWAIVKKERVAEALLRAYAERGTPHERRRIEAGFATAEAMSWENAAKRLVEAIERNIGPVRRLPTRKRAVRVRGGLTVAVPARNANEDLTKLHRSFLQTRWNGPKELLILDDASNPRVPDMPETRILRSEAWLGEGAARDILVKAARGEFMFMTDADVELTDPDWAERLADGLPARTIRHPLMCLPDGRIWSDGGCYKEFRGVCYPSWHYHLGQPQADVHEGPCVYAPGAGWFMRTDEVLPFWDWIGGYFPTIFADVDMAFWLRHHGFVFEVYPHVRIVHNQGSFTCRQTDTEEQRRRFHEHAQVFASWWEFAVEDDIARGAFVCR